MNLYIDARALQMPKWQGQQFYVYRILEQMTSLGTEHTFHLHFTRCETVKCEIVELFGFPAERIIVAPCAVDRPDPDAPDARPVLLPEGAPFFLMVNPGAANKNWQDALAAFALYTERHPEE